ncbi:hypothetical protein NMG60_11012498 [Bertholletia excelsa]
MEQMVDALDGRYVLESVEDENKELSFYGHSKRLAQTLSSDTKPRSAVQIGKNLHISADFHIIIEFISKVTTWRIVVKDASFTTLSMAFAQARIIGKRNGMSDGKYCCIFSKNYFLFSGFV